MTRDNSARDRHSTQGYSTKALDAARHAEREIRQAQTAPTVHEERCAPEKVGFAAEVERVLRETQTKTRLGDESVATLTEAIADIPTELDEALAAVGLPPVATLDDLIKHHRAQVAVAGAADLLGVHELLRQIVALLTTYVGAIFPGEHTRQGKDVPIIGFSALTNLAFGYAEAKYGPDYRYRAFSDVPIEEQWDRMQQSAAHNLIKNLSELVKRAEAAVETYQKVLIPKD